MKISALTLFSFAKLPSGSLHLMAIFLLFPLKDLNLSGGIIFINSYEIQFDQILMK